MRHSAIAPPLGLHNAGTKFTRCQIYGFAIERRRRGRTHPAVTSSIGLGTMGDACIVDQNNRPDQGLGWQKQPISATLCPVPRQLQPKEPAIAHFFSHATLAPSALIIPRPATRAPSGRQRLRTMPAPPAAGTRRLQSQSFLKSLIVPCLKCQSVAGSAVKGRDRFFFMHGKSRIHQPRPLFAARWPDLPMVREGDRPKATPPRRCRRNVDENLPARCAWPIPHLKRAPFWLLHWDKAIAVPLAIDTGVCLVVEGDDTCTAEISSAQGKWSGLKPIGKNSVGRTIVAAIGAR